GNGTFSWSGPNNFTSTEQNPVVGAAGTYMLTVTGTNGCTSMASAEVTSNSEMPSITATGGTIDCETGTLQLTSSSPSGELLYVWNGTNEFYSTEQNPIVDMAGTYILTVTAGNGCSNSVTVFVTDDCGVCPPMIEVCGPDLTIECGTTVDPNYIEHPIFRKDPLCPAVTVYWTDQWFGECPSTLIRTWYASDETGAEDICIQTITVVDTQGPVFSCDPEDITVKCDELPAALECTANDACSNTVTVIPNEVINGAGCDEEYTIIRTWTATDDCGNSTVIDQVITVVTNLPPTPEAMVVSSTPNPFRFQTKIAFVAPEAGHGLVEVYDLQGRRVAELFNTTVAEAQLVSVDFKPEFHGSGTFIYRIIVNGKEQRGRMVYQP
ncbi:MAG: T9SS type A sorting domain-containing protein, partial [Flavobacteriales bacterium]